jgi:hypothetical protein
MENAHDQILENLLHLEECYQIQHSYFTSKTKVTKQMRAKLVTWMLEVCEEQRLTDELFALSVNIFDRLMYELIVRTQFQVEVYHLQLFGIVCLFIAAKLKAKAHIMTSLKLIEYTDNSVRLEELLEWECLVLDKLKWDIAAILPNDYIDIFVHQFHSSLKSNPEQIALIKKHFGAFTALCSLDFKFTFYPSSMLAGACLLTSIDGLIKTNSIQQNDSLVNHLALDLANLINCDIDSLLQVKELVDSFYKSNTQIDSAVTSEQTDEHQYVQVNPNTGNNVQFEDDYDFDLDYNLDCLSLEIHNEYLITSPTNQSCSHESNESGNSSSSSTTSFAHYSPFLFEQEQLICTKFDSNLFVESASKTNHLKVKKSGSKSSMKKKNSFCRYNSNNLVHNGFSRSSSSSSGISSIAGNTNYACSLLTPPMANLVPLPQF